MGALAWAVLLVAGHSWGWAQEVEPDHDFRFGFSSSLMGSVSENDPRAAMKVWAETVFKSGAVTTDPNVHFSHDLGSLLTALQRRSVDGVAMLTSEYLSLRERVPFNRFVFGVVDGSITEEYLLLVHQDAGVSQIKDLQGRTLQIQQIPRMSLAVPWLDTALVDQGLKPVRSFFAQVIEESKLTKTVLPVFFRKADACLVTRKGFKAMTEMNPQVGRQLRVVATSPQVIATGFFFRMGCPQVLQDRCLAEFTQVHKVPAGQQILTVFQTERLEEHPQAVLSSSIALLETHRQLCGETRPPETTTAVVRAGDLPQGER